MTDRQTITEPPVPSSPTPQGKGQDGSWNQGSWRPMVLSVPIILIAMLVLNFGYQLLQERARAPLMRILIHGQELRLEGQSLLEFGEHADHLLTRAEQETAHSMQSWVDASLEEAFASLDGRVDAYLDWHFSALGSYTRLVAAARGELGEWSREQLRNKLVDGSGIEVALAEFQEEHSQRLDAEIQARLQGIQQELYTRFEGRQADPAEAGEEEHFHLDFDGMLADTLDARLDLARTGVTGPGGLLIGRALVRRFASGVAMHSARAAVTRFLTRMGIGFSRSLAMGGGVATASAPTGPGALVAGTGTAIVSLTVMAGTEWAGLELQERRLRPEMEAQLRSDIADARREFGQAMAMRTRAEIKALTEGFRSQTAGALAADDVPCDYRVFGGRAEGAC